jgi:hypothetical protein
MEYGCKALKSNQGVKICVTALLIIFSVALLKPALKTGYYAEDHEHSNIRGILRTKGVTILDELKEYSGAVLAQGRFYPITPVLVRGLHYTTENAPRYKFVLLCGTIVELVLFFLLVRRWTSDGFAGLTGLLFAGLYQFRLSPDPLLGYYLQMQVVAAGLFGSLLALELYLEGRGRVWLVLSALAYTLILLTYENCVTFAAIHLAVLAWRCPSWRQRLRTALPFAFIATLWVGTTLLVRERRSLDLYVNHPSAEPVAYFTALLKQISSAIPFSYFLMDPHSHFSDVPKGLSALSWLLQIPSISMALGIWAAVVIFLGKHFRGNRASEQPTWWPITTCIGILLIVLPTVLVSASPFHQARLQWGSGWVSILIQMHGTALILATALWMLLSSKSWGAPFTVWKRFGVTSLVAVAIVLTQRVNADFLIKMNHQFVCFGSVRANVGDALRRGLLEELPEHSVVLLTNEYPCWFDRNEMYPGSTSCSVFFLANVPQRLEPINAGAGPLELTQQPHYRLTDICLDDQAGYVILSRQGEVSNPAHIDEVRAYVHCWNLFQDGKGPAFLLAEFPSHDRDASCGHPSQRASEFQLVRSGEDWGIFSLRDVDNRLDAKRLRLVFDQAEIARLVQSESVYQVGDARSRK